ncbi:MAG: prepilin-type N-terminal cleavage/methylation domain-containing protein [Candidatus Neomarinimicrobiota bacterium]
MPTARYDTQSKFQPVPDRLPAILGFTLIELIIVMIIIGIISGITTRTMLRVFQNANYASTISELNVIAEAMVGNPEIVQNNIRTNFGYVGDTFQFPPTLDDLVSNVSSVDGWDGPYIDVGFQDDPDYYKTDAWGNPYIYTLPADPTQPPTILTPANGDTIVRQIASSVNSILGNTVTVRLINAKGIEVDGTSGEVQISYSTTWHDLTWSKTTGFQISSVPIGLYQLRAISGGDTTYKSLAVDPDNRTTSQPQEMLIFPSWGDLVAVPGSIIVEGTCQDQLYFGIKNTGSVTYDINQLGIGYGQLDSNCWNCSHPYLESMMVSNAEYWNWNTNGTTALVDSGAIITLDQKLKLYAGSNILGPFTFQDETDGSGNCVNLNGTFFTFKFFSSLSPTRTVTLNAPGNCTTPVLSVNGSITRTADEIDIPVKNTSLVTATFNSLQISTDLVDPAYLAFVQFDGVYAWQAPVAVECPGLSRPRVDNGSTGTANFLSCTGYLAPTIAGNATTTIKLKIEGSATGSTPDVLTTGTNVDLTFYFTCPSGHSQSLSNLILP